MAAHPGPVPFIQSFSTVPEGGSRRFDLGVYPIREGRSKVVEPTFLEFCNLLMPVNNSYMGIESDISIESRNGLLPFHGGPGIADSLIDRSVGSGSERFRVKWLTGQRRQHLIHAQTVSRLPVVAP